MKISAFFICVLHVFLVVPSLFSEDEILLKVNIRAGTLELNGVELIFRSESGEREKFGWTDFSFFAIPGLKEVGLRLDNGKEYFYEQDNVVSRSRGETMKLAISENRRAHTVAMLYQAGKGGIIAVRIKGRTPILRADFVYEGGTRTFWATRNPASPDPKPVPRK